MFLTNCVLMLSGIGMMVRVFTNGPGDLVSIPSHTKDSKKWHLMPPCLTHSIVR